MRQTVSPDRFELFADGLDHPEALPFDGDGNLWAGGEITQLYRIDRIRTPNFAVFDREGNLYFSDSGEWRADDGFLFVLRPNGEVERLLDGLSFPNGLSLSADEKTLFVVQSTKDNVLTVPLRSPARIGQPRVHAS